jgi:hypothetical protein
MYRENHSKVCFFVRERSPLTLYSTTMGFLRSCSTAV